MLSGEVLKKRFRYFVAVTLLFVAGYVAFIHYSIETQESHSAKISLALRQKAIAEELLRRVYQAEVTGSSTSSENPDELRVVLNRWEGAQKALLTGSQQYEITQQNSTDVQIKLQDSNHYLVKCRDFVKSYIEGATHDKAQLEEFTANLESYEFGINLVISSLIKESEELNSRTVILNWSFLALIIVLVILEWYFVKKPLGVNLQGVNDMLEAKTTELSEAETVKTEFLANVTTEIKTPLGGVLGMADLLSLTKLDEEQRGYVRSIHNSTNLLLELVNDVLDFSNMQSGKLELHRERFNLAESVEQIIDLLKPMASIKQLELMSDIDAEVPQELVHDEKRFRQVLQILVNNAIKYTDKGEVSIHAEVINREADFVQLQFAVKDTGVGISKEAIEKLFDSYYRDDKMSVRKNGGSGLGLAIAKELVQKMGGRIHVESELGVGSTFYFTIVAEKAGTENTEKLKALSGMKALVVDDNKTNLKILVKQLSAWGIQATPFNSPDLVSTIIPSLSKFDFIILDMQMPEMDGNVLARQIRKQFSLKELPIIIVSSIGEQLIADNYGLYNAYLTKPIKQTRLLDSIFEVMQMTPTSRARRNVATGNSELTLHKSNLRILVAQDNELSKAVTAKTLELLGHHYQSVDSTQELVEKTKDEDFDLIIMDMRMNQGDSIEAARLIKKHTAFNEIIPVIFGLSENEQSDKQHCTEEGMDDLVQKPVLPEVLQEKIYRWLEVE